MNGSFQKKHIYICIYIYTLEVQRPLTKKHVFTKDYFHVENFNRPKLGTIILIVFDFQGVYMYIYVYIHPGFHLSQNPGFQPIASSLSKHYPPKNPQTIMDKNPQKCGCNQHLSRPSMEIIIIQNPIIQFSAFRNTGNDLGTSDSCRFTWFFFDNPNLKPSFFSWGVSTRLFLCIRKTDVFQKHENREQKTTKV